MTYTINVSRLIASFSTTARYSYHFRIENLDRAQAETVLPEIQAAFPSPQFNVELTRWENTGQQVEIEEFLSQPA
jgi:hypothetical protein